ncbi:MAG: 6-carboxytetrahydropterin synthase [Planctomycetota bacterium]
MYRLSREVRFAIDLTTPEDRAVGGRNGYAGKPPITGIGQIYYALVVTVRGEPSVGDGYIVNIKDVDGAVRERALPEIKRVVRRMCRAGFDGKAEPVGGLHLLRDVFSKLADAFSPHVLDTIELKLSPHTRLIAMERPGNTPMTYLKHTFEFAASHRLHNPAKTDEENVAIFGKCNNPHGHGHNYQFEVTLRGEPDEDGFLINFYDLERIVDEAVVEPLDHKHLNVEVAEFQDGNPERLNPSVEFIAKVIYRRLQKALGGEHAELDAVTVWETPKTWCEYREPAGV